MSAWRKSYVIYLVVVSPFVALSLWLVHGRLLTGAVTGVIVFAGLAVKDPVAEEDLAMKHDDAILQALGYAWGQEDATGRPPWATPEDPSGSMAFAKAYAQGWDEYNQDRRGMMTNLCSAYERWQATGPDKPTIWDEHTRPAKPATAEPA